MKIWLGGTHDLEYTYHKDMSLPPIRHDKPVIVVVDPGKTNMAMLVGDLYGKYVEIIELSGTGCSTDEYCRDFTEFVTDMLREVDIIRCFQEETVLPKKRDKEHGGYLPQNYYSADTLSEIKGSLRQLSFSLTGEKAYMINNKTWKHDILPKEYRGNNVGKGSYLWLSSINPAFKRFKHDVTDVFCMYLHALKVYDTTVTIKCDCDYDNIKGEVLDYEFIDSDFIDWDDKCKEFEYNQECSLYSNIKFFKDRSPKVGYAPVDINWFSNKELFKHCKDLTTKSKVFLRV